MPGSRLPAIKVIDPEDFHKSNKRPVKKQAKKPTIPVKAPASTNPRLARTAQGLPLQTTYQRGLQSVVNLSRTEPTVLFTAPSHMSFNVAAQCQASFCVIYAINTFQTMCMTPPADLSPVLSQMFAAISFTMVIFAGYLSYGPSRMIRSIVSMPAAVDEHGKVIAMASDSTWSSEAAQKGRADTRIIIEKKKFIPFGWGKVEKLVLKPDDLELLEPIGLKDLGRYPSKSEIRLQEWLEQRAVVQRSIESQSGIRRVWSTTKQTFVNFCQDFGRVWTKNGLADIYIKGKTVSLRLDMRDGTALQKGHIMDRLFIIRSKLMR